MAARRPPRRVTREVPRWQRAARSRQQSGPFWAQPQQDRPWWLRRRDPEPAGRLMASQAQPAGRLMVADGTPAVPVVPPRLPRQAWRFRRHAQPFIWLVLLLAAGAGLHRVHAAFWWGLLAAAAVPALMLLAVIQQHKDKRYIFSPWVRRFVGAQAVATSFWLGMLAGFGLRACLAPALLTGGPFLALWVRHYRWRPVPAAVPEPGPEGDLATFAALAGEQKWRAQLGAAERLDGGGRKYLVQCDGIKTTIGKVLAMPDNVAGAWHKPVTECYAERDPKGITSRGYLTILGSSTLQTPRNWAGTGMDPATGLATVGRFADGKDVRFKMYTPRFGTRHALISGTTGSGKSGLLELLIFTALTTGWFVPVILDPQEGQSLPFWRDRCIYASGVSEVEQRLRGLHAGMMDRSQNLATMRWTDQTEHGPIEMPGMPFFDYALTGLRMPLIVLDEAHMVLKDGSKWQRQIISDVVEVGRLGRKAGTELVLATHVPGLAELGGSQALRDMLRGGNVWSGRTANKVAGGMIGLVKDPSEIPRFFADGRETAGLGYADGPENRPDAPMRTDRVPSSAYVRPPEVGILDDRFLEVMDRAMKSAVSPTATVAPAGRPAPAAARGGLMLVSSRRTEPEAEPADDAPEGRRCVDAVWKVLAASAGPMERGEVIAGVSVLAKEWGRDKPWTIKAVGNALRDLADGKVAGCRVTQPVKGGPYQV